MIISLCIFLCDLQSSTFSIFVFQTGLHIIPRQYSLLQTTFAEDCSVPWDLNRLPGVCEKTWVGNFKMLRCFYMMLFNTACMAIMISGDILSCSGMWWVTSGLAHQVKEMTTFSIATLLTRRSRSPRGSKSGTGRCRTRLLLRGSSTIIRSENNTASCLCGYRGMLRLPCRVSDIRLSSSYVTILPNGRLVRLFRTFSSKQQKIDWPVQTSCRTLRGTFGLMYWRRASRSWTRKRRRGRRRKTQPPLRQQRWVLLTGGLSILKWVS